MTDFHALYENRRRAFAALLDASEFLGRTDPEHPDWERVDLIRDIAVAAFEQADEALHRAKEEAVRKTAWPSMYSYPSLQELKERRR